MKMRRFILIMLLFCLAVSGRAIKVKDVLTLESLGLSAFTNNQYGDLKVLSFPSGTTYYGNAARFYSFFFKLRSLNNSCLFTKRENGHIVSIKIKLDSRSSDDAILNVYGSRGSYQDISSISNTTQSTILYSEKWSSNTSITITPDSKYRNFGILISGGTYIAITSIEIVWDVPTVNINVSEVGYSTLYYSDAALTIPNDVTEAYTYRESENGIAKSKTYKAGEVIPAGEAVVIKATEGKHTFSASSESPQPDTNNILKGTDEKKALREDNCKFYMLSLDKDGSTGSVGFYWGKEDGGPFTNGAHKAYLKLPKDSKAAKYRGFAFNTTTGILVPILTQNTDDIDDDDDSTIPTYNLSGQRVDKNYKGIVIRNGKKHYSNGN